MNIPDMSLNKYKNHEKKPKTNTGKGREKCESPHRVVMATTAEVNDLQAATSLLSIVITLRSE